MTNLSKFIAREQHVPLEETMFLRHSNGKVAELTKFASDVASFTALQESGGKYDFHKYNPKIRWVVVITRNASRGRDEVHSVFRIADAHESGTIFGLAQGAHLAFERTLKPIDRPARLFNLTSENSAAIGCNVTGWGSKRHTLARMGSVIFDALTVDLPSSTWQTLIQDFDAVNNDAKLTVTTRDALISARVGQGEFRAQVLNAWSERCAATRCSVIEIIRASHIKPWRDSTNPERLDPNNGLPLIATLDALFDAGLITFELDGTLLCSALLPESERDRLALPKALTQNPTHQQRVFLAHHKQHQFRR